MRNTMELLQMLADGDKSVRNEIVLNEMNLVYHVAKNFYDKIDKDTAIQEGSIGLIKAVDNFDITKGLKFSTFAVPYIDGYIRTYIRERNDSQVLRIRRQDFDIYCNYTRAELELSDLYNREPSLGEVAEYLGVTLDRLSAIIGAKSVMSLELPVKGQDDEFASIHDILPDLSEDVEDYTVGRVFLEQGLRYLDEKSRYVLEQRFVEERSQVEISRDLHISQPQLSRLEKRALKKLKEYATA